MVALRDGAALWQYMRDHGAKLDGLDLRGLSVHGFAFDEVTFVGTDLRDADLEGCSFGNCDLSKANFSGANLGHASLFGVNAAGADFSNVDAIAADFAMSSLTGANFAGSNLERANFTEADASGADFTGADLTNTVFAHAVLDGATCAADFVGTMLVSVDLSSVKLLENAHVESVIVDHVTLQRLRAARERSVDISAAVALLRQAEVPLDATLAAIAEVTPSPSGATFDLIPEFRVPLGVSSDEREAFRQLLDTAQEERPIQAFLEEHPAFLACAVAANHRGWVLPQPRLGAELIPDFLVCGLSSQGYEWLAVELESPTAALFTQAGEQSAVLRHAVRQVQDWRVWFGDNVDYARRPREGNGLGLRDISSDVPGLILIGRRAGLDPQTRQRRRRLMIENRIEVRTYDYLLEMSSRPLFERGSIRGSDET